MYTKTILLHTNGRKMSPYSVSVEKKKKKKKHENLFYLKKSEI